MTLIVSYVWKDKIITIADSRISKTDEDGRVVNYSDDSVKLTPIDKQILFGSSGLRKVLLDDGQYLDTNLITQHFIKQNSHITFANLSGENIISALAETWKGTLNPHGIDSRQKDYEFKLIIAKWEEVNSLPYPNICTYSSTNDEITCTSIGIAIGDQEALDIIKSYTSVDIEDMDLDDTILHFKRGFKKVIDKVDTVGGTINTYILESNSCDSYWHNGMLS